jgi:HlyD family secretion protein
MPSEPTAPVTPTAAKRSRRKPLWIALAIVVVLVGLGVPVAMKRQSTSKAIAVTTEKAGIRSLVQKVSATGKIQPELEVKISPEVAGEIVELPVREGAQVKKGDLLLKVKPDNYLAQVEQREADLAAARAAAVVSQAQLTKTEEDFQRTQDLFNKQLVTESEFTAARTAREVAASNRESALAQIRRAEGTLKQARDQLDKTTVYAPIDGRISALNSERGERVVGTGQFAGTEVMRVADLESMEVRVNVNENDVVNVKVGQKAKLTIDAFPNRIFNGEVKEIASSARTLGQNTQEEVTNFLVKIRVTDRDPTLRPGMSANADIETKTVESVVAVPIQSVTVRTREGAKTIDQLTADREKKQKESQGEGAATAVNARQQKEQERSDREKLQRVVFIRNGDTVKQVPVETGIFDTTHMEMKSGVKEGDEVVSGPFGVITRTLKDGSRIRIEKPKKEEGK